MLILNILLFLILMFVIVMHYKPDWYQKLTMWFHIRTKYLFLPWQYYEAAFQATGTWTTIELPFAAFRKSNFYQPSYVSSQDIKTIGIVAIGREFVAEIDLASIELY